MRCTSCGRVASAARVVLRLPEFLGCDVLARRSGCWVLPQQRATAQRSHLPRTWGRTQTSCDGVREDINETRKVHLITIL